MPNQPNSSFTKPKTGKPRLEVRLEDETVWLSQNLMAELFQKDVRTINEHIKNVFEAKELKAESTIRNFRIVQKEGDREVTRKVDFYNLDMIISINCYGVFGMVTEQGSWLCSLMPSEAKYYNEM